MNSQSRSREFQEIAHSGGVLTITPTSIGIRNLNPNARKICLLCYSINGFYWSLYVPRPDDFRPNQMPAASCQVHLLSDSEGFFGRICFDCKKYFRTSRLSEPTYCPYCLRFGDADAFHTDNQRQFIKDYLDAVYRSVTEGIQIEVDLDALVDGLEGNKTNPFVYAEERQQLLNECVECKNVDDILGEYGRCSMCGRSNAPEVFARKIAALRGRLNKVVDGDQPEDQLELGNIFVNAFSEFEAFGRIFKDALLGIPTTPARRRTLRRQSLQQIAAADEMLESYFGIGFFKGDRNDRTLASIGWQRRHIIVHRGGIVDEDYLKATGDNDLRLGQKMRLTKPYVGEALGLVGRMALRFMEGYESLGTSLEDEVLSKDLEPVSKPGGEHG